MLSDCITLLSLQDSKARLKIAICFAKQNRCSLTPKSRRPVRWWSATPTRSGEWQGWVCACASVLQREGSVMGRRAPNTETPIASPCAAFLRPNLLDTPKGTEKKRNPTQDPARWRRQNADFPDESSWKRASTPSPGLKRRRVQAAGHHPTAASTPESSDRAGPGLQPAIPSHAWRGSSPTCFSSAGRIDEGGTPAAGAGSGERKEERVRREGCAGPRGGAAARPRRLTWVDQLALVPHAGAHGAAGGPAFPGADNSAVCASVWECERARECESACESVRARGGGRPSATAEGPGPGPAQGGQSREPAPPPPPGRGGWKADPRASASLTGRSTRAASPPPAGKRSQGPLRAGEQLPDTTRHRARAHLAEGLNTIRGSAPYSQTGRRNTPFKRNKHKWNK